MATIKEVLLLKIAAIEKEIADEAQRTADILNETQAKFDAAVKERKASIKAMQTMIALYDKNSVLFETVTVEAENAAVVARITTTTK